MCTLCAALDPQQVGREAETHARADRSMLATAKLDAPYTMDQIADYLVNGFWEYNRSEWRAFDVQVGDTLTYDISALYPEAQFLAVSALQAWADVTGLVFEEFVPPPAAVPGNAETGDAAASTATTATTEVGEIFTGALTARDRDWVSIELEAGKTYTFTLDPGATGGVRDPYLELRSSSGALIAGDNNSGTGKSAQITFTADTDGTYFLAARAARNSQTGTYDLTATEGTGEAQITFATSDSGAYSTSVVQGNTIVSSFVNVDDNWMREPESLNSYWFQTYVHEVGHALGLGHAGPYNGSATFGVDNAYDNDSWQATVMSYFSQEDNTFVDASEAYLLTVMQADILAMQTLYGVAESRPGNTVWGYNSNVGGYLQQALNEWFDTDADDGALYAGRPAAFTVHDTGGIDTLNLHTVTAAQRIDLTPESASDVAGLVGNLWISRGTIIENVNVGAGNDTVIGNDADNTIQGRAGHDLLEGGRGDDTLLGDGGFDTLDGGAGDDALTGGANADTFVFSGGLDEILDFTDNIDTILFEADLWGGAALTAQQLLDFAVSFGGATIFTFGADDTLLLTGVADESVLLDDIAFV